MLTFIRCGLFAILVFLSWLDYNLTRTIIETGIGNEYNPILQSLISHFGIEALLPFKMFWVLLVGYLLFIKKQFPIWVLFLVDFTYLGVVFWQLHMIDHYYTYMIQFQGKGYSI